MRRIIIEYYNGEYHIQLWSEGKLKLIIYSQIISEHILVEFLKDGILPN